MTEKLQKNLDIGEKVKLSGIVAVRLNGTDSARTADTVNAIVRRFPGTRFVWLMGADNLKQIRRWRRWRDLFRLVPIAVLDRPTYSLAALSDLAARAFARYRVTPGEARHLADMQPPAWTYLTIKLDHHSASAIRQKNHHR